MPRSTLTDVAVKRFRAPPVGKRIEHWDEKVPGLALRITDKGAKSWVTMYRIGKRQRRHTLGSYPSVSLADARALAQDDFYKVAQGIDPAAEKRARRENDETTFASVVEDFIKRHASKKRRGWETKQIIDRELMPYWAARPIGEITKRDVRQVVNRVMDRGAPRAANRLLSTIRKLGNWAVDEDYLEENPAAGIKPPGEEVERDRVLSDDEIRALWKAWGTMSFPFGRAMQMLLTTGQRLSEVRNMRWTDIDLGKELWTLPRELTKSDRSHEVPLSSLALQILETVPRFSGDYVFTTTSGERPVAGLSKAKRRADTLSGVIGWRVHDLRRSTGTAMGHMEISEKTISRVMNHKEGGVTQLYNRASYLNQKQRALDRWGQVLTNIIRPSPEKIVTLHRR